MLDEKDFPRRRLDAAGLTDHGNRSPPYCVWIEILAVPAMTTSTHRWLASSPFRLKTDRA
jgi:hypothetical protein